MNQDELLAAADTVVREARYGSEHEWLSQQVVTAADKLATHVQRLYDPTPVDEAFARVVAAEVNGTTYFHVAERERECATLIRWSGGFHLMCGGFSVAERATRGDVRRLCDALGVELREAEPSPSAAR